MIKKDNPSWTEDSLKYSLLPEALQAALGIHIDTTALVRYPEDSLPLGIDMTALVHVARDALGIEELPEIEIAYKGQSNAAFLLKYRSSGRSVAARFPLRWVRDTERVEPTAAAMTFARHILGLPVPEVLAWNATYDNVLGMPYMLLEYISHCAIASSVVLTPEAAPFLQDLARCHAALARPLPVHLDGVGELADPADVTSYILRPLSLRRRLTFRERYGWNTHEPVGTPFHASTTCLPGLWDELWDCEMRRVVADSPSGLELPDWFLDVVSSYDRSDKFDPESFPPVFFAAAEAMRLFYQRALRTVQSSPELGRSCLVNIDYFLRNVLVDTDTLKLKALVAWDDVYVMPFALSMDFPDDLLRTTYKDDVPPDSEFVREGCFASFPHDEYGAFKVTDVPWPDSRLLSAYNNRVCETANRDVYRVALAAHDARFADRGLWEARKPILKSYHLLKRGVHSWWRRREWLRDEIANQIS